MAAYDLEALSPLEFEELIGDLLQAEMGIRFELFKPGRDNGIDLRNCLKNENIIVQCKHYFNSSFRDLKKSLESEKEKVMALQPTQYIIATSCGLTPANKKTIKEIFHPYCLTEGDIYGRNDILKLLKDHEDVVKKNYKLWFTSEAVLRIILHSGTLNQTETDLENFKDLLPKLVMNDAYFRVQDILKDVNTCVICGQPGIGKSTLMKLFVWNYASQGYQPVKIYQDIKEAYDLFDKSQKQIYYYDDFLGETFLESGLGKNEGSGICSFIKRINKMPNKKFILTTREHVLNQALFQSEKISGIKEYKSIISLSDFSLRDKAQILYNYLWHSNISKKSIQELLNDKNYMKIIQHRNFNPRVIQWMTCNKQVRDGNYLEQFLRSLDNPSELWSYAFEHQISSHSQTILLIMGTFDGHVCSDNLWMAFKQYYASDSLNQKDLYQSYRNSTKELEGSFIKSNTYKETLEGSFIKSNTHKEILYFEFNNPSVRDFINNYLLNNKILTNTLCEQAVFFDQLNQLWNIFQDGCRRDAKMVSDYVDLPLYLRSIERLFEDDRTGSRSNHHEKKILFLLSVTATVKEGTFVKLLQNKLKDLIQQNYNGNTWDLTTLYDILVLIKNSKDFFSLEIPTELDELIQSSKIALLSNQPTYISDFSLIKKFIDHTGMVFEPKEMDVLKQRLNLILREKIKIDEDMIYTYNPDDNCFDQIGFEIQDLEELGNDLINISSLFDSCACLDEAVTFVHDKIEEYYESIDASDIFDDDLPGNYKELEEQTSQTECEIERMFETLNDK